MAFSFDDCGVNPNLLVLLCEENTNSIACFADLEADHQHQKRRRTHQVGPGLDPGSGSQQGFFPLLQSDETVRTMVERERELLPRSDYLERLRSGDLDLSVRREALDWIWKAHSHYSFGPVCICLATNYLDRFLSVYELPRGKAWTVQLLAVACLSLAAKMDETNVPQSVDLQVGDPKFLFEAKTIRRMELLVLSTLKWRMLAFTACSFIDHFLRKIFTDDRILPSMSSFCRSAQLILGIIGGIDFLEFRPSEIAASVAISISGEIKAVDIDRAISSFIYVEKGRVLKCLELMKDLSLIGRFTTNRRSGSVSASASIPLSPVGVLEAASLSYNISNNNNNNNNNNCISNNNTDIKRDALAVESRANSSSQTTSASTFTTTTTMTTSGPESNKKRKAEAFF